MARFTADELCSQTHGQWVTQEVSFSQDIVLSSDTRTIGSDSFFVPLSGERFDGHDYLVQAFEQGAQGAFVSQIKWAQHPEWAQYPNLLAVEDPLLAYLEMARFHRMRMNPKVVAVTGSSGKTTTKEMLYAALSGIVPTQKSEKNFNNEVGLCQTLLALQPETQLLIVEMGMRGLEQIALLSYYAIPDIGVVVNVGPAHIGLLGSLENIARAKCEIFTGMQPAIGIGVVNGDDALLCETAKRSWSGQLLSYSLSETHDIHLSPSGGMVFQYQGVSVQLSLPGRHNVSNALAVLKVGEALGLNLQEVARGLCDFQAQEGRWEKMPLPGVTEGWVINDAYNANPDSIQASLQAFLDLPAPGLKRILVLGGMKELGDTAQQYHEALAQWLLMQTGISALYTVGAEAQWIADALSTASFPVFHSEETTGIIEKFKHDHVSLDHTLLFLKGSRAFRLEAIPDALCGEAQRV